MVRLVVSIHGFIAMLISARNIPVHRFLQRHVYGVSRAHMSRPLAYFITFLVSALAHELVMFCVCPAFPSRWLC